MRKRVFLRLLAGLPVVLWTRGVVAAIVGTQEKSLEYLGALDSYLDTLIPRDETGSATDLGVGERMRVRARRSNTYLNLLQVGCFWLDGAARKRGAADFQSLDTAARVAVVTELADEGERPGAFFRVTRRHAFDLYYAKPEIWRDLKFDGPPQPRGFPDHAQAPR